MSFMKPQVYQGEFWKVETSGGTYFFPTDIIGEDDLKDCVENEIIETEVIVGYGARLSAPGYMDCTDWTVHETEEEAKEYLKDMYDLEE